MLCIDFFKLQALVIGQKALVYGEEVTIAEISSDLTKITFIKDNGEFFEEIVGKHIVIHIIFLFSTIALV